MISCRFEQGNETDRLRHVVADIICVDDAKVLLIRRAEHLVEGGKWALPGGFMDRDETLIECARREFREETGFDWVNPKLLNLETRPVRGNDDRQTIAGVFLCGLGKQVQIPDDESTDIQWFPMTELEVDRELAFDHNHFVRMAMSHLRGEFSLPLLDGKPVPSH